MAQITTIEATIKALNEFIVQSSIRKENNVTGIGKQSV